MLYLQCRGSTIAITDVSGNITDTFAYDTYGKCISRTGTGKFETLGEVPLGASSPLPDEYQKLFLKSIEKG